MGKGRRRVEEGPLVTRAMRANEERRVEEKNEEKKNSFIQNENKMIELRMKCKKNFERFNNCFLNNAFQNHRTHNFLMFEMLFHQIIFIFRQSTRIGEQ